LSPALSISISNKRFDQGHYLWDDHQDNIFVKSTELDDYNDEELTGVEHYRDVLDDHEGKYAHICSDFNDYCMNGKHVEGLDDLEEEDEGEVLTEGQGADFTELPKAVDNREGIG
jgi:hypothetical protein